MPSSSHEVAFMFYRRRSIQTQTLDMLGRFQRHLPLLEGKKKERKKEKRKKRKKNETKIISFYTTSPIIQFAFHLPTPGLRDSEPQS